MYYLFTTAFIILYRKMKIPFEVDIHVHPPIHAPQTPFTPIGTGVSEYPLDILINYTNSVSDLFSPTIFLQPNGMVVVKPQLITKIH